MKKFVKTEKYGQLYVEKVFLETYFPVIFTCTNDDNEDFFAVCCKSDASGCKWLIAKIDPEGIIELLSNSITMRDLLLTAKDKFSVDYIEKQYSISYDQEVFAANSVFLPKKDSFMYAEEGEFDDEIAYYKARKKILYEGVMNTLIDWQGIYISGISEKTDSRKIYEQEFNVEIKTNIDRIKKSNMTSDNGLDAA